MNIHFIGIGGISMSGLALISKNLGHNVSGSDSNDSEILKKLEKNNILVFRSHRKENIKENIDLIVYTAAVLDDNPELMRAKELLLNNKIQLLTRAEFLGNLMSQYENTIAVSGTHGKTSTTSMLSSIFIKSNLNPTITIGGNLNIIDGNYFLGGKKFFITEACEYVNSFLSLKPKFSIILNIDFEHIDFFSNEDMLINSFLSFANNTTEKIIANGDDSLVRKTLQNKSNVLYFGFSEKNDFKIKNISLNGIGSNFDLFHDNKLLGNFQINVLGEFNILNATSAIIVSYLNGISISSIKEGIESYTGVDRRFEKRGEYNGAILFDDYAHHPKEVKSTIYAASQLEKNRLITIFQPHTFSRTFAFLDDFSKSFSDTDILILTDIYPSRERDTNLVHSKDLYEKLKSNVKEILYISDFSEIVNYIKENAQKNDIIITMGAGNVNKITDLILQTK